MMRTILVPAALAALLALATSSQVHAYGAYHRTATYTNPYTGRSATVNESTASAPTAPTTAPASRAAVERRLRCLGCTRLLAHHVPRLFRRRS